MSNRVRTVTVLLSVLLMAGLAATSKGEGDMGMSDLTPEEEAVIVHGGTERPYTGEYVEHFEEGSYHCRRCGASLYESDSKFMAHCGWPAFDSEVEGAVERRTDADGYRTEILCAACGGHLGHVFEGEGYTDTDTRHCVNSISLEFVPAEEPQGRALFAAGCFWGVESAFQTVEGVLETTVGYTGGSTDDPGYYDVCSGTTGHAEAVEVIFDPVVVSYEDLARFFFEIHDPTTPDRQGVDIGTQYRSAVFPVDDAQRETVEDLMAELTSRGYAVVTQVETPGTFWPAEEYHQDYYARQGGAATCHIRVSRFNE